MAETNTTSAPQLSRRGRRLAASPPIAEYLVEHFARSAAGDDTPYTPLCIAENRLVWDLLQPKMTALADVPHQAVCYDQMTGSAHFRRRLAGFMERHILGRAVSPDRIAVLAGAGTVLEILFHALADPGDAVLIPTPSYAGFWPDLETRDQLVVVPVHRHSEDGFRLTTELLDRAAAESDRPVRALLFTSPDNPLGRVFSRDEIEVVLQWAEQARIHVVFDEIYALSVFGDCSFTSCASLRPELGDFVHVVWAFSKDFGASGLRCGVLVTENEELMAAVDALSYWACCSGHTQHLLAEMLGDETWVEHYATTMRRRLGNAHDRVSKALTAAGIPHFRSDAGFFLVCDLRSFMESPTWEAEQRLWRRILDRAGANLTPGAACRIVEPGFFRLCFGSVPTDEAVAAVGRMAEVLRS